MFKKIFGRYRQVSKNFGRCWQMSANFSAGVRLKYGEDCKTQNFSQIVTGFVLKDTEISACSSATTSIET